MDDGVIVLQLCSWKSRDGFQRINGLGGKATSLIRAGFLDVDSVVCKKFLRDLRLLESSYFLIRKGHSAPLLDCLLDPLNSPPPTD